MADQSISDAEVSLRVTATQEAQKASRLALLTSTVAFLSFTIALWNSYLSWAKLSGIDFLTAADNLNHLDKEYYSGWMRSRVVSVPPLGITIDSYDAVPLCSGTMLVIAVWFCFASRRENFAIGTLLQDTRDAPADVRRRVFHGVASYSMFKNIRDSSPKPIRRLDAPPVQESKRFLPVIFWLMCFQPAICTLLVILADFAATMLSRMPSRTHKFWIDWLVENKMTRVVELWYGFGVAVLLATWFVCLQSRAYLNATEQILGDYRQKLLTPATTPEVAADSVPPVAEAGDSSPPAR